ncbi:MAG: hypothetical protein OXB86_03175 [Bdellovibrionales bacterium]|nr:hypothetical protein [Bdellovibrionales bacterium]
MLNKCFQSIVFCFLLNNSVVSFSDECKAGFSTKAFPNFLVMPIERLSLFPYEHRAKMTLELRENLKKAGIVYLGDLIAKTPEEVLEILGLKESALPLINKKLTQWGLELGMNIDWPEERQQVETMVNILNPKLQLFPIFTYSIKRLHFSSMSHHERIIKALKTKSIFYIGDLVGNTPDELLRIPGIGKASVEEIERALAEENLHLGMNINWPKDRQQVETMVIQWNPGDLEQPVLYDFLDILNLSSPLIHTLKKAGIIYIGDLVGKTPAEILKITGIEQAELAEIEQKLSEKGFHLNMNIIWPANRERLDKIAEKRKKEGPLTLQVPPRFLINLIDDFIFSNKIKEILKNNNVLYMGDLVRKTPEEILKIVGIEQAELAEIEILLKNWELELGMNIIWPTEREQVEALVKKALNSQQWPPFFLLFHQAPKKQIKN